MKVSRIPNVDYVVSRDKKIKYETEDDKVLWRVYPIGAPIDERYLAVDPYRIYFLDESGNIGEMSDSEAKIFIQMCNKNRYRNENNCTK